MTLQLRILHPNEISSVRFFVEAKVQHTAIKYKVVIHGNACLYVCMYACMYVYKYIYMLQ